MAQPGISQLMTGRAKPEESLPGVAIFATNHHGHRSGPDRPTGLPAQVRDVCTMRTLLLAACLFASAFASAAAPARAQVIEISDDGSAQVFDGRVGGAGPAGQRARVRGGQFNVDESINRAAQQHGLDPGLLRAVAWQESRGNNAAVSDKGALGIMQLMPGTAAALPPLVWPGVSAAVEPFQRSMIVET